MAKNPATAAAKWSTNLQTAATNGTITDGINGVTVAPGQAAARQVDVWASNVVAAKAKWQKNVSSVSLNAWQQAAINKGVGRIAAGAQAAEPVFNQFMTQLIQYQQGQLASLPPRGNLQANTQRAVAWIQAMSKFSFNKSAA